MSARRAGWIKPLIAGSAFALIAWAEWRRPLRRRREPQLVRTARNITTAAVMAAVTAAVQIPLLSPLSARVERERLGLLYRLPVPTALRRILGVLLLDYSLWWWHWANHAVPFFWRFHLVHHVDRDLDASTAIRFHFGEMALSVFYRAAQMRVFGVDHVAISIWQTLLLVSVFFHHSNLKLPPDVERQLVRWIVTPRMHGIHHSDFQSEASSNWSSLLSWWDWLHGTLRLDVEQRRIEIGVAAYQRPEDVTLGRIHALPFRAQRDDWRRLDRQPQTDRPAPVGRPELITEA